MTPKPNVVLEESMVPETSVLLEPEDVPIPDADDLVIEILTEQMNESSKDVLEIFAATDKKRGEVNREEDDG